MKFQRIIATISCLFVFLFLLTSCSGYNSIIRDHLSDEANYNSYHGEICDIYYFDANNKKVSLLSTVENPNCDVVIELTFDDCDVVRQFLGGNPNPEWSLDQYTFSFDITKENNQILFENEFYDTVVTNTLIELTASSFIYMDSDFFFVAAITYNDTEYLRLEDGIQNIQKYINARKSLL